MKVFEGKLDAKGLKMALIVSRYNGLVTTRLLSGAKETFTRLGGQETSLTVVKVPGSFELPLIAKKLAESKKYDAIVCLGAVIRGDTPHFEYVSQQLSRGLATVMTDFGLPVAFGVITSDNLEQAIDRAGAKSGNKGEEAMMTAVEMVNLMSSI